MKHPALCVLLFAAATSPLMAQTAADTTPPTITISTPAINSTYDVVLSGTATDTGSGTGTGASTAGIQAVYYQKEGSSKWNTALLTAKGSTTTTWVVTVRIKGATGTRYYFRAVDTSGNESDVVGRRFKHGS